MLHVLAKGHLMCVGNLFFGALYATVLVINTCTCTNYLPQQKSNIYAHFHYCNITLCKYMILGTRMVGITVLFVELCCMN